MINSTRPALELLLQVASRNLPPRGQPVWFLRGRAHPLLQKFDTASLFIEQTFYPHLVGLRGSINATPLSPAALTLCLGTKQRKENFGILFRALAHTKPGASVLFALENDLGGKSYEKHLRDFGLEIESSTKMKSRLLEIRAPESPERVLEQWEKYTELLENEVCGLWTHSALFGWNKVDRGSELLAHAISGKLSGRGADLGSGFGYLSRRVLEENPAIEKLTLVEAELYGLAPAAENLRKFSESVVLEYRWANALNWRSGGQLDFVITNPPFHHENRTDPELARAFLLKGLHHLHPGGALYYVSHKTLTLPDELIRLCQAQEVIAEDSAFHVVQLIKC